MMGRVGGVVFVKVDQGALGHKRRKPTWLITNIEEVILLDGTTDVRPRPPWPTTLQGRLETLNFPLQSGHQNCEEIADFRGGQDSSRLPTNEAEINKPEDERNDCAGEERLGDVAESDQPGVPSNAARLS